MTITIKKKGKVWLWRITGGGRTIGIGSAECEDEAIDAVIVTLNTYAHEEEDETC